MNLRHYSALAAAFLAMKNKSDAQIVYTDIPDTSLLPNSTFSIDLNGDGITDFKLSFHSSGIHATASSSEGHRIARSFSFQLQPHGSNGEVGSNNYVSVLDCNDSISKNNQWLKQDALLGKYYYYHYCYGDGCISTFRRTYLKGNWLDQIDHYIGVKFIYQGQKFYGWIRLDVIRHIDSLYPNASHGKIIVKDFAYETKANAPILPGVVECGDIKPQLPPSVRLCGNDSEQFVLNLPTCLSYAWYKNEEIIAGADQNHFTTSDSARFYVVVSGSGCSDTSNVAVVAKYPAAIKPVIATKNDSLISSPAFLYQWEDSSKSISGATNQFYIPLENSDSYQVMTIDENNCSAISDDQLYATCALTNTRLNLHDTVELCQGMSVTLSVINPNARAQFDWFRNGFNFQGGNSSFATVSEGGLYFASVRWFNLACRTDSCFIRILTKPLIILNGPELVSSSQVANQWLLNGAIIPGATQQDYFPSQSGYYSVEVTGYDGCTLKSDSVYFSINSVSDISFKNEPIISYLNPAIIQIKFPGADFLNGKIKILNSIGQLVKEMGIDKSIMQIPFAENETGWFIIDIEKGERKFRSPVVIF